MKGRIAWEHVVGILGLLGILLGETYGLTPCASSAPWASLGLCTPPDSHMGESVRIMYVHVPSAWNAMLVLTAAFVGALVYLITGKPGWDHVAEAASEVGTLLCGLVLFQGAMWAKPTWGVFWAPWEPRLTTTAIMFFSFASIIVLRALPMDGNRRALFGSTATLLVWVTVPITYFIVRLIPSIHQMQSSPTDVDGPLRWGWRLNSIAMGLLVVWFVARRWRIARARHLADAPPPLPEATSR